MTHANHESSEADRSANSDSKASTPLTSAWDSMDKDKLTDIVHKVASETESIIKKYPVASVFAALTVGFALGSLIRRSRD
jgi:hypothetical protein